MASSNDQSTSPYPGTLITLEGIDGSGKSTLARNLAEQLLARSYEVVLTKEPGDTRLGQALRKLLHEHKDMVCDQAEFLLFAADRAQHFQELVMPALQAGKIVISDRMADSSMAYQGHGRGLDCTIIGRVNSWAMHGITPDVTLYLEISPTEALKRVKQRNESLTSFEQEKQAFWARVQTGFEKIFQDRKNVVRLDATSSINSLTNQAITAVHDYITQ